MKGQVFDYKTNKCTDPLSGPGIITMVKCKMVEISKIENLTGKYLLFLADDCKCWYECDAEGISRDCPTTCQSDCRCGSDQ